MKKFNNNIQNSNEKKIKKGLTLPSDAINLGYVKTEDVTPGSSLVVIDSSTAIKENVLEFKNKQSSFLANEIGMLYDPITGSTRFPTENVYVSDFRASEPIDTKYVDVLKLNQSTFGKLSSSDYYHSYYVSRYFTAQENIKGSSVNFIQYGNRQIASLEASLDAQRKSRASLNISINDIYVTYADGSPYVDQSGKKKYDIFLESYNEKRISQFDRICRIIILLEDPNPSNLILVYPKLELTTDLEIINENIKHSEQINAVPLFTKEGEETFVVDVAAKHNKTFATKSSEKLEDMFSTGGAFDSRGFNIFVNKKALPDNRSYEVFNWRVIGKIKRTLDYANRIDGSSNGSDRSAGVIKAAVIKANTKDSYIEHHKIFGKLNSQNNPINIYNYQFTNPISDSQQVQKTNANDTYWTVDLSSVTTTQARSFDILILVINENTNITSYAEKIQAFLNAGGCLFIESEGTSIPDSVKSLFTIVPGALQSGVATGALTYNRSETSIYSELNLKSENQSWDISANEFDTGYGVYGLINNSGNPLRALPVNFSNNSVVSNSVGPVIAQFKISAQQTSSITAGNIIINTVGINKKAGADYLQSTSPNTSGQSTSFMLLTSDSEGPLKFFYNSMISGITSKYYTTSNASNTFTQTLTLPTLFHATSWKTDWCLNGPTSNDNNPYNDILIKNDDIDEYALYNIYREQNGDLFRIFGSRNYKQIFLEDFNRSVPSQYAEIYASSGEDVVEYYVEFTNSTISPKVGTLMSGPVYSGTTTPYKTYKLTLDQANQIPTFKTSTISLPLNVPRDFGQFYISDRYRLVENRVSNQPNVVNDNLYNYQYNFKTSWNKVVSSESSLSVDIAHRISFTIKIPITYTTSASSNSPTTGGGSSTGVSVFYWEFSQEAFNSKKASATGSTQPVYPGSVSAIMGIKIPETYAVRQDIIEYEKSHNFTVRGYKDEWNHYPYTGDIDITGENRQYSVRSEDLQTGDYVYYIQSTLIADGYNIASDGTFGPNTNTAVRSFQQKYGLGIVDGQVDSQTKSTLAYFWIKKNDEGKLDSEKAKIKQYFDSRRKPEIAQKIFAFIDKAIQFADPKEVSKSGAIRRISYTDSTRAPSEIEATIYLKIPASVLNTVAIESIEIKAGRAKLYIDQIILTTKNYDSTLGSKDFGELFAASVPPSSTDLSGNKTVEIPATYSENFELGAVRGTDWKYLILKVRGSQLPVEKYGTGKGIFIEGVWFWCKVNETKNGSTGGNTTPPSIPVNADVYADVYFDYTKNNITTANSPQSASFTSATVRSLTNLYVSRIYEKLTDSTERDFAYTSISDNSIIPNRVIPITTSDYKTTAVANYGDVTFKMQEASIQSNAATITNFAVAETGSTPSTTHQYINYITRSITNTQSSDQYTIQTTYDLNVSALSSTVQYGGEQVLGEHRHLYVANLRTNQNPALAVSPTNKNSINYIDGIVCFSDANGRPVGFPNFITASSSSDTSSVNITNISIQTNNNFNSQGIIYGFYDLSSRKFLGQNISYAEYEERNGPENVYIAAIATDYDGNTVSDDIDFTGFSAIPVSTLQVPNKIICPIYNVYMDEKVSIKVLTPQSSLDKRDPWYISVTSGSFNKNIEINPHIIQNDDISWISKYRNEASNKIQTKAFYDTTYYNNTGWSQILGQPYIDVVDEIPDLIDSRTIRLRQVPFATMHEPSDDPMYFSSPIKPFVFIDIKENGKWRRLKFSEIDSFNSNSGIIYTKANVIPNDPRDIRVKYAVRSAAVPIKIIDSKIIKINPFIYNSEIEYNKPIYIYMIPRSIQVIGFESMQRANNDIYEIDETIKLTNDNRIFNPTHPKYNPFAQLLATIYVIDESLLDTLELQDLRLKGGGIKYDANLVELVQKYPQAKSFWDISGPRGYAYSRGGYVIVRLPAQLNNYMSESAIRGIIRSSLTAGVVFELQDYSGQPWKES